MEATRGLVLTDGPDGSICDTRFSKCCGGVTERFSACWADEDFPYLIRDTYAENSTSPAGSVPDLSDEQTARDWILSSPEAFCNTSDPVLLSTVLNSYDQETADFYRWKVEYTQAGLSDLLRRRSGIDFGDVLELRPLKRGASGRIIELRNWRSAAGCQSRTCTVLLSLWTPYMSRGQTFQRPSRPGPIRLAAR